MDSLIRLCDECHDVHVDRLEPLGLVTAVELPARQTVHVETHYRCRRCGARWLHVSENGATGSGDFVHVEP